MRQNRRGSRGRPNAYWTMPIAHTAMLTYSSHLNPLARPRSVAAPAKPAITISTNRTAAGFQPHATFFMRLG